MKNTFRIERVQGLYNCFLKNNTVELDIMENNVLTKHYHHYKTREKAEYMFDIFGKEAINKAKL